MKRGPAACGQPPPPDSAETRETGQASRTPGSAAQALIPLSVAEIRRLLALPRYDPDVVARGLAWSAWRRAHQAHARRSHFRRRLKLQVMQI